MECYKQKRTAINLLHIKPLKEKGDQQTTATAMSDAVKNKSICYPKARSPIRDSTGTGTGTVPAQNNVVPVRSRNIFCSRAGPCEAFSLDLLQIVSINVYFASCVNT